MRFHHIVLIAIVAGCAPQAPGAGTEGHPCRTGFSANWACNDGLRCMNEGCVPCGKADEVCCFEDQTEVCHGSDLACAGGNDWSEGAGKCTPDCGFIGLGCCGNECPGSGECVDGACVAPITDPCFDGKEPHVVLVVAADCAITTITLNTDTLDEAEQCRAKLVEAAAPGAEVCAVDQATETHTVCKHHDATGYTPLEFDTCSDAQLAICEQYNCLDGCTWAESETCP